MLLGMTAIQDRSGEKWITLFNGKNLEGWTPKIKGYDFGENFGNTFRVSGGSIVVNYGLYDGKFDGRFGHLFWKNPYSNYILRLEYRFVGKQMPDGPSWAYKNSGIMIHCQPPKTMGKEQDFPVSAEVQLLGGDDTGERPTANVCSPGTNIVMNDKLITQHCNDSKSKTFRGEVWVAIEVEVHGNGEIIHRVNGEEVLRYSKIQYDPNDADAKKLIKGDDLMISGGYISLQSESHPVEFRNIQLLPLDK